MDNYCVNCYFHDWKNNIHICWYKNKIDIVTGKYINKNCYDERSYERYCGEEGHNFIMADGLRRDDEK